MKIYIPNDVQNIIDELEMAGHSAYIVGGCVRDAIMGKQPHDYDICTSATPEKMKTIFKNRRIIETGLKHGTVTVGGHNDFYEVTTYRIDGEYLDGRHPDGVVFVDNIEQDLARRDFTMNAIAYNKKTGFIDPFGGICDIANKQIRCVGCPDERFMEDALRIMRAVRFASICGFLIESETNKAMFKNRGLLKNVSEERKCSEFCKMLLTATYDLLNEYRNIFAVFIPELKETFDFSQNNPHHQYDVYSHMIHSVDYAPQDLVVRLALFFHDIGKPFCYTEDDNKVGHFYGHPVVGREMAEKIMYRMRFDTKTISDVCTLIDIHDTEPCVSLQFARRMLGKYGEEQTNRLIVVEQCDKNAQTINKDSIKTLKNLEIFKENINKVLTEQHCVSIRDLDINGDDLKKLGIPEGILIGKTLNHLLNCVLENPELNKKPTLIQLTSAFLQQEVCEI